jgi:hypothetical protein
MPNGPRRPSAKIAFSDGALAPSAARSTRTRPAPVSATKMSPFGATRSSRGPAKPEANCCTVKPAGTDRTAPAGRATFMGLSRAEGVAKFAGRSATLTVCRTPGPSLRQSPGSGGPPAGGAGGTKSGGIVTGGSVAR